MLSEARLTSDCGPLSNEVECECCSVCCDDKEENKECAEHAEKDHLALFDPQWEDNYDREEKINYFQSLYSYDFSDWVTHIVGG